MPLPLTDPRWNELEDAYGGTANVVAWLAEAQRDGGFSDERFSELINEVQHQGDTSPAMYAVAPHLVAFARQASTAEAALGLLIAAGMIHAASDGPRADPCPNFLKDDFAQSAAEGACLLAPLLPQANSFADYKYAVAALAGFIGHRQFARFLDGLDLYEGRFHHSCLEGPFPEEE